jgi:hypothetical protein
MGFFRGFSRSEEAISSARQKRDSRGILSLGERCFFAAARRLAWTVSAENGRQPGELVDTNGCVASSLGIWLTRSWIRRDPGFVLICHSPQIDIGRILMAFARSP